MRKILDVLITYHSNARFIHPLTGKVYQMIGKTTSGSSLTAFVNSLYTGISFRYVFFRKMKNNTLYFDDYIRLWEGGDDNLYSERVECNFTPFSIAPYFTEIGLTYTSTDKSGELLSYNEKLDKKDFLKRYWRWDIHANRIVCPLELEAILKIPLWTKRNQAKREISSLEIFYDNVDAAIRELSLHGDVVYDMYVKKYRKFFQTHPHLHKPRLLDFDREHIIKLVIEDDACYY